MKVRIQSPLEPVDVARVLPQGAQAAARTVHIKSYGCQMNAYDAERMLDLLKPYGFSPVETAAEADLVILNTCHIREKADNKMFSDAKRMWLKTKKRAIIAVGGCVGQAMGQDIMRRAPHVNIVFGPQTYHRLPEFIA